jgi:hypothetical protein
LISPADWEDADGVPQQGHGGVRRPHCGQARVPAAVVQRQGQVTDLIIVKYFLSVITANKFHMLT